MKERLEELYEQLAELRTEIWKEAFLDFSETEKLKKKLDDCCKEMVKIINLI